MSKIPIISLVGRQNVGKSTLFNAILKKQVAITYDLPGVTRDVLKYLVEKEELSHKFYLCDTPGLDIENLNDMSSSLIQMSFQQLVESDVIVYLIDKSDVRDYDFRLMKLFREDSRFADKNIIYCANKADNPEEDYDLEFFYKQGIEEVLPISALGRRNIKLLLEKIDFFIQKFGDPEIKAIDLKITIVGKPNSGKSSLLNAFLGYNRSVVSEIAGTTRDSVNAIIKYENKQIEIVDTAGIRKATKNTKDSLEFYSYTRALKSIENADVVIHIFDAMKGIGEYDKKIFSMVREKGKPLIFAVNKWDLIEDKDGKTFDKYKELMISRFNPSSIVPVISISASLRQRVQKLLGECLKLYDRANQKIPTNELNRVIKIWMDEGKFALQQKKVPKVLYVTQVSSSPFKLILFVNHTNLFKKSTLTFLKKKFTEKYKLSGIPVEIELRSERDKK
ncbi:MAG: ribosome biogenesis GTPase Der [Leptospiraceae bacterium]|nr:ribosome biogenesis GTPase Der [Leptospiraceae bacterium]